MTHPVIEQFRERQLFQLIDEVRTRSDRVAFIPTIEDGVPPSSAAVYASFISVAEKSGYKAYSLNDRVEHDIVVLEDSLGRPSLWVDRHLPQRKCRDAFLEFINQYSNKSRLEEIGKEFHVDHAFNKARVTNAPDEVGDDAVVDGNRISAGYLRLFLIEGPINTGYGATIEKSRSNERLPISGFRMASWMVLLKLSEIQRPVSDHDFLAAVRRLKDLFGAFPFQTDEDFIDSLRSEMRLIRDRWSLVVGDQVRSINRDEVLLRLKTHSFHRSRLARLIHEYFGWSIFNLARDDGNGDDLGVRIGSSDNYYVAASIPYVVQNPEVLRKSPENGIPASDIQDEIDNPGLYTNLIKRCNDEVSRMIKAEANWESRVRQILSRDRGGIDPLET